MPPERIVRLGKDNFWQAGRDGPCGPCSEIFFDRGTEHGCGRADCGPDCECDRFMEFYNLVFMEYDLRPDRTLVPLPSRTSTPASASSGGRAAARASRRLRHRRLPAIMIEVSRGLERRRTAARPERDQGAHRVLADHGRAMTLSDRRRRHALERGPRLHLPPDHPPGRPARPAHRARGRIVYRLRGCRRRADGRRLSRSSRARRRDRAAARRRGGALPRDARDRRPKEFDEVLAGTAIESGRGGLPRCGHLRLPDRADRRSSPRSADRRSTSTASAS